MGAYLGSTEPQSAGEVAVGDRLVHDKADAGYLTVAEVVPASNTVYLKFDEGSTVTYPLDTVLHRVPSIPGEDR